MASKKVAIVRGVLILVCLIAIGLFINYFENTEKIEITSKVAYRYVNRKNHGTIIIPLGDEPGDPSWGVPIESDVFHLVLEDGSNHEVSTEVFVKYTEGDYYTYTTRVWKG